MCPPTYFKISYTINSHMNLSNQIDSNKAKEQWECLKNTYIQLGLTVIEISHIKISLT